MDPVKITIFGLPGFLLLWLLTVLAFGVFGYRIWQLVGLLRQGRYENRFDHLGLRVVHAVKHVLLQPRIFNERAIGLPHFLIFWGAEKVADICMMAGAEVTMADDEMARNRLWDSRRSVSPALFHLSPRKIGGDIVVPRQRIPQMLMSLKRLSEETGIGIVNFGHAGDGNFHVNLMVDRDIEEEAAKAGALIKEIFRITLEMGGTISGEPGVGLTKKPYIGMEVLENEMRLMKGMKGLFDPKNILNPGKIFP